MIIKLQPIMDTKSYPEAGDTLFDILVKNINEDKIVIDLEGVVSLPSIFLNVSIGKYIKDYGIEKLRSSISFTKISETQAKRLNEYISKLATS
ncbi:MAG: STAS-like domain-containing protein [Alistipes sp.]|nr:STAS-like domain-containing protein [Alistipes sp.]